MKINYSVVFALTMISQQAFSVVNEGQLKFAAGQLKTTPADVKLKVKNWAGMNSADEVIKTYRAQATPAAPAAPAAPRPQAAPKAQADAAQRAQADAAQRAQAEAAQKAQEEAAQRARIIRRQQQAEAAQRAQAEAAQRAQAEAAQRAQAEAAQNRSSQVSQKAKDYSNNDIAGAAYLKLKAAGYEADQLEALSQSAGAQRLAGSISSNQQSKMLGRLSKSQRRYSR